MHPALQIFRDVAESDSRSPSRDTVWSRKTDVPPRLAMPTSKRDARAQRGLLENQREEAAGQRVAVTVRDAPSRPRRAEEKSRTCAGLHSVPVSRSFVESGAAAQWRSCSLPRGSQRADRLRWRFRHCGCAAGVLRLAQAARFELLQKFGHILRRMMNGGSSRRM